MTDTDKLKRLADDLRACIHITAQEHEAILALIAENERLEELYELTGRQCDGWKDRAKVAESQRNEAVALLREFMSEGDTSSVYNDVRDFLARIDGNHQPASDANPLQSRL